MARSAVRTFAAGECRLSARGNRRLVHLRNADAAPNLPRSEGCLAAICVAVAYPLFIVANMVLLATAPYRIGTVASLSFDALFIFILVWDLLFIPLTVLSHRIVGDMMPMARSGTAPGRWGRVAVAVLCFGLAGFFAWGFHNRYWQWRNCIAQSHYFCQADGAWGASTGNRYWAAFVAVFLAAGLWLLPWRRRRG